MFCVTALPCKILIAILDGWESGSQLKLKPNAVFADDALKQQCAMAHGACKMEAMLTSETSDLTGPDL